MEWFYLGLRYMIFSIPMVFAVLIALFGCWMVIATASRATVGAWVVGVAFLIQTAFVASPSFPFGINVSSDDLAFTLLAAALIARVLFFELPPLQTVQGMWFAFGGIFFISLGVGLLEYGSSAGVEARSNFYFWMAGLYFASFVYPPDVLKKLWSITQWCAWLVVAIVVYRWVGLKLGFVSLQLVELIGASSEFRVVGSDPTFFIGIIGVAHFSLWLRYTRQSALVGSLVMLGLAVVLQHRSVWISTLGALIVVTWHQRTNLLTKVFPVVGISVLLVVVIATSIIFLPSNRLTETLTKSAESVGQSRGTDTDRIEGWKILLEDYSRWKPHEWLLGKPYGTGYRRYVTGRIFEFSPHNFYIQFLLRLGVIGLMLFLWVHFSLRQQVRTYLSPSLIDPPLKAIFLATLAANFLYYIPYQGFYLQGVFYGVLIGYLSTLPKSALGHARTKPSHLEGGK